MRRHSTPRVVPAILGFQQGMKQPFAPVSCCLNDMRTVPMQSMKIQCSDRGMPATSEIRNVNDVLNKIGEVKDNLKPKESLAAK